MSTQNANNRLQTLSKFERMQTVRNVPAVSPDQDHTSASIGATKRAVKTMPPALLASFERIDSSGGGVSNRHDGPSSGRLGPFPFQLEGTP